MRNFMKKSALFAGLLFAWPLLAQNPPTPTPPAPNPPVLEQPKMAEPEEEKKADTPAPVKAPVAKKAPISTEGKVVEEIVARVNNDIITRSELDRAKASAADDAQQECSGRCTPEQLQIALEDRQKFALRDLIDQSLLSQRGKDLGISVETDVVKQLD